ncbi:MAG: leucine-rich repeat domain-containing protein [Alloprevotella sp.]
MKRLLLSATALFAILNASAEEQTVVLTTSQPEGQTITLLVNATRAGVTVDWGDGTPQAYTSTTNGGVLEISGTLKGANVTVKAAKGWKMLAATDAGLTAVDLSKATELRSLYLQNNALTSINVANMAELRDLNLANNQLTAIALNSTKNPLIETLDLSNNPITATSFIYGQPNLRYLNLSGMDYTSLTLTKDVNLDALLVANNALKTLTLTATKDISLIDVRGNKLEKMTMPTDGLPQLQQLLADDNYLEDLDISVSTDINTLTVARNEISKVTLPSKSKLQVYDCSENALTFSSLPRKTYVPSVYFDYSDQAPFDISALGLTEGSWGSKYLPWLKMNPDYASRGDAQYQLDMSAHVAGSGSSSVQFEIVSVTPEGEKVLEKASATNKTLDYSFVSGKITVLKEFPNLYIRMTDSGYPDLTVATTHFAVIDPTADGIEEVTFDDNSADDTTVYDLQGRRTQSTAKGIYIVGSKKVIR